MNRHIHIFLLYKYIVQQAKFGSITFIGRSSRIICLMFIGHRGHIISLMFIGRSGHIITVKNIVVEDYSQKATLRIICGHPRCSSLYRISSNIVKLSE